MKPRWQAYLLFGSIAVLILCGVIWLASELVARHDATLKAGWETQQHYASVEQQNKSLLGEVERLKAATKTADEAVARKVAAEQQTRQKAQTPPDEVLYIKSNSPLHPELTAGPAPHLEFPVSDTTVLADLIVGQQVAQTKLAGCEVARTNLAGEVAALEKVIDGKDDQLQTLKKQQPSGRAKWFGRGVAVGGVLVTVLLHVL